MPFIIVGMSIVGGILILWSKMANDDTTIPAKELDEKSTPPREGEFDVERLRQARREIKKQIKLKNKVPKND